MLRNPWLHLEASAWSLGIEASSVILLRTMKLAAGGAAAEVEARRMSNEKIEAGLDLHASAMTGRLGLSAQSIASKTLVHYRRKVRANRRRLIRK